MIVILLHEAFNYSLISGMHANTMRLQHCICAAQMHHSQLSSNNGYRDAQLTAPNMRMPSAGWKRSVQRGYHESKSFCSKLTAVGLDLASTLQGWLRR